VISRALEVCPIATITDTQRASLKSLEVVRNCDCGCDTVEFQGCGWREPPAVIAEGLGVTTADRSVGLIVFGTTEAITCLEVYSFDDEPARLPILDSIRGYGEPD
jgi:hypothetical protein